MISSAERPVPASNRRQHRIVLTTFGSLGDLHPYIAIARELKARGHEVILATSGYYRQKIEALGLGFRAVRPDHPDTGIDLDLMRRIMDRHRGSEVVIRELMMPVLRESYVDTLAAAEGADLLVSHMLTFTARLVAEKQGIRWASTYLQPLGFFSAYDPPVLPQVPQLAKLRFLGPTFHRLLFWCAKQSVRSWSAPWHRLRAEVGLPPTRENPLFEGQNSPSLVLALFSKLLAAKQPDWPPQSVVTGFPFFDEDGAGGMPPELVRFLDDGPPPLVFTLGSSAVMDAGRFYEHSVAAAERLGCRAVLLVGHAAANWPTALPEGIVAFAYAPFSALFPRAAAIVHQGGIGTTAQAMRSGRPMLVMPYAHDQLDNADRVQRLGIARTITRESYTADLAAAQLRVLLDDPGYSQLAAEVGRQIRQVDGVGAACDALEGITDIARPAAASGFP